MLQLMQDSCGVGLDCCISYLKFETETHSKLFRELNELTELMIKLGE